MAMPELAPLLEVIVKHSFAKFNFRFMYHFQKIKGSSAPNAFKQKAWAVSAQLKNPESYLEILNYTEAAYFLQLLADCRNEAFISEYEDVLGLYFQLSKLLASKGRKEKASMSKKPLAPAGTYLNFFQLPVPPGPFFIRLNSLWQSGLRDMWMVLSVRIIA